MKKLIYPIILIILSLAVAAQVPECTNGMTATIVGGVPSFECHMTYCDDLVVNISIDPHQDAASNEYNVTGCAPLDPLLDNYTGGIRYQCPCTNDYTLNITTLPNSNGTYTINFLYNYSIWVDDPTPSGGGGRSSSSTSSGGIINFTDTKTGELICEQLMFRVCLNKGQRKEFYIQNDGKAWIQLESFEENPLFCYQSPLTNGTFQLTINESHSFDLFELNNINDIKALYYGNGELGLPCIDVYSLNEACNITEEKEITEQKNKTIGVEFEDLKDAVTEPPKRSLLWVWIIVFILILVAAIIYAIYIKKQKESPPQSD